jgi:hypothetical protein
LVVVVQTDRQAYRDPAAILLVPGPARVVAGQRLAELAVTNGGQGSDLAATRRLVRWRPIPAHNLLLHAQMAQINGQVDQVIPPLEAAASRGWREPQLQLLVGRSALLEGNHGAAAQRLAALLAIGSDGPTASQLAADLLAKPAGRRALIGILATPGRYTQPMLRFIAWNDSSVLAEDLRAAAGPGGKLPCATIMALAANYRERGREQLANGLSATRCPVG